MRTSASVRGQASTLMLLLQLALRLFPAVTAVGHERALNETPVCGHWRNRRPLSVVAVVDALRSPAALCARMCRPNRGLDRVHLQGESVSSEGAAPFGLRCIIVRAGHR